MNHQLITSPVLVGRAQEQTILQDTLRAVVQGNGRCLLISGEAGVGKSRLLAETRRRAEGEGFLALQGHCFEPDLTFPYAPVIDALRTFFAHHSPAHLLGPLGVELVKLLPELALTILGGPGPSPTLNPEAEKRRSFESLAQFLTGLSKTNDHPPLLFIFEDIHWADETSLDFLHFFARRLTAFPMLLIASYRHDEVTPQLAQTLALLNR